MMAAVMIMQAALGQAAISESHALSIANGQKTLQELMKVPVDTLLPGPLEIIAFSEEEGLRCNHFFSGHSPALPSACMANMAKLA